MGEKCVIFYNSNKAKAVEIYTELKKFLKERGVTLLLPNEIEEATFSIVIGGDGTLLRASKEIIKKDNIPVIAINAGSLGFLTEIKEIEARKICENYLNKDYEICKRGLLELKINNDVYNVLNEIVISTGRLDKKLMSVDIFTDRGKVNTYIGDGVIIASPTGSTAYSLSAGGPIVSYRLDAFIITPISPHNLSTRTIILSSDEIIKAKVNYSDINNFLMIDGDFIKKLTMEDDIEIKYSNKKLNLVLPKDRNYYSVLKEKLKWGDNLF
ncbi:MULTISPECIES: NAD(+)/NADH kinase [Fusobacterium]|uniref:NAD(+)/NADH kinase n=1 Tax=Fusobacterium TaxID=848 RepID=UPI001476D8CA|nr:MULTISPECIES: NAD(+)/NADH kinase [Fusobacterium]NME36465.1 NAD(+)/NADH kinase [Fusobacterium sp. FSA-380-WT-3A]